MFNPDIPYNVGAMMRLAACFGVGLDLIEPFGFVWDDAKVRRVAMDYIHQVTLQRHKDWHAFKDQLGRRPLVLLTTRGSVPYDRMRYAPDTVFLVGRESAGAPDCVHTAASTRVVIPLHEKARSLNITVSAAIVLSEALRQQRQHSVIY